MDLPLEIHVEIAGNLIPRYSTQYSWEKDHICTLASVSTCWKDIAVAAVNEQEKVAYEELERRRSRYLVMTDLFESQAQKAFSNGEHESLRTAELKMAAFVSLDIHSDIYISHFEEIRAVITGTTSTPPLALKEWKKVYIVLIGGDVEEDTQD